MLNNKELYLIEIFHHPSNEVEEATVMLSPSLEDFSDAIFIKYLSNENKYEIEYEYGKDKIVIYINESNNLYNQLDRFFNSLWNKNNGWWIQSPSEKHIRAPEKVASGIEKILGEGLFIEEAKMLVKDGKIKY